MFASLAAVQGHYLSKPHSQFGAFLLSVSR